MTRNKSKTSVLAVALATLVVLSGVAPFAGVVAPATAHDTDDLPDCLDEDTLDEDCAETIIKNQDLTAENIEGVDDTSKFVDTVSSDDYLPTADELDEDSVDKEGVSEYTESSTLKLGDITVKYIHVTTYNPSTGEDDYKIKEMKLTRVVKHDGEVESRTTLRERDVTNGFVLFAQLSSDQIEVEDKDVNFDDEKSFVDTVSQQVEETADDTSDTVGDTTDSTTEGSITDYDINTNVPVSIHVQQFKDSQTADEPFEFRAMPPTDGLSGDIKDFDELMSKDGQAKIRGQSDMSVGMAVHNVPTSDKVTLVFETKYSFDDQVNVRVVNANGETLQTAELQNSIQLNDKATSYVKDSNTVYVVLEADGGTVNQHLTCAAVVVDADNPTECNTGQVNTQEIDYTEDSTVENSANDLQNALGASAASGSILDYDYNQLTFTETVRYATAFEDGKTDGEYMERPLPVDKTKGVVSDFPKMVDGNDDTSATFTARNGGLKTGVALDNVEKARNHVLVMNYEVNDGSAPDVTVKTAGGDSVTVSGDKLASESGLIAVDLTKISDGINSNNVAYVVVESDDGMTTLDITCMSIVGNVENPDKVTCDGSLNDEEVGGTEVVTP